jgi:hypothetical protein
MGMNDTTASLALTDMLNEVEVPYQVNPRWDDARPSRDWRNHVPVELKRLWWHMHPDARKAIMIMGIALAEAEPCAVE